MNTWITRTQYAVGVGAALALLTACTGGSDVSTTAPTRTITSSTTAAAALTADQVIGGWGAEPVLKDGQTKPWIQFHDDGTFSAFDGCSSVGGPWTIDMKTQTVTAKKDGVVGVACAPSQEASFTAMKLEGKQLIYKVGTGDIKSMTRRP